MSRALTTLAILALALGGAAYAQEVGGGEDVVAAMEALVQKAADRAAPCVVSIRIEREPEEKKSGNRMGGIGSLMDGGPFRNRPANAPVSGTILEADGTIVTTAFNVGGKLKSIEVTLHDGRTFKGELKGFNANYDLAVIRIEATDLPTLKRSNLDRMKVGQTVVVVGCCPGGKGLCVNPGIMSAPLRLSGRGLQMDCRMNYGNVGAPLVDAEGRLIGITCRVDVKNSGSWGQNSGVGFAITWDKLNDILPDLKKGKTVAEAKKPFLGIQGNTTSEVEGVEIQAITPGGAAEKHGLKVGDVIVEFDGKKVKNFEELRAIIMSHSSGDKLKIKLTRGDEEKEIEVVLGEAPGE